jgi:hypothetical protein
MIPILYLREKVVKHPGAAIAGLALPVENPVC